LVFSPPHSATDQSLGEAFLFAEVIAQQPFVVENDWTAAVRVDHCPVVIATPRNFVTMPPKGAQLGPVTAANYEVRSWPVIGDPADRELSATLHKKLG